MWQLQSPHGGRGSYPGEVGLSQVVPSPTTNWNYKHQCPSPSLVPYANLNHEWYIKLGPRSVLTIYCQRVWTCTLSSNTAVGVKDAQHNAVPSYCFFAIDPLGYAVFWQCFIRCTVGLSVIFSWVVFMYQKSGISYMPFDMKNMASFLDMEGNSVVLLSGMTNSLLSTPS